MGEIADMILEGMLCEECGTFIDDECPDHPRKCAECAQKGPSSSPKRRWRRRRRKVSANG